MKKKNLEFFVVTASGLEKACAAEMHALALPGITVVAGGVAFCGGLRELYLANLWLRTASRILVRFAELRCRDFPALYRKALRLPWGRYVKPGTRLRMRVTCRRSRLHHSGRIAEAIGAAAQRALGGASNDSSGGEQLVIVSFADDVCRLSLDSSGELLHRRGYRRDVGPAPLRETLAAGILMLLGWQGDRSLYDPMCGSGTLLVEGALLALNRPPGRQRSFAFMEWPGYRPGLWQVLLSEADRAASQQAPLLAGADRDAAVLEAARRNARRAGVLEHLALQQTELRHQSLPPRKPGLAVCNPPYGARLGRGELPEIYRALGTLYGQAPAFWQRAFLCADGRLAADLGLPVASLGRLRNGGIEVELCEVL